MKKVILIALFACIVSLGAQAQKLVYGVKISGGFAYQQIINSEILSSSSIKTFNIQGLVQLPLKHDFWLQGELGIASKGDQFSEDALTTKVHITYLDLPVSILRKFNFTNLGLFYIGAGGYAARGIGGKLNYETPGSESSDKLNFGRNNDVDRYDMGLNFSTGFEFKNQLTFNIGYQLGLNNIASAPQEDTGTSVVRNREFTIGLGYLFK